MAKFSRVDKADFDWAIPTNAQLTIPDIERAVELSRGFILEVFNTHYPGRPVPVITSGIVQAVFDAIVQVKNGDKT